MRRIRRRQFISCGIFVGLLQLVFSLNALAHKEHVHTKEGQKNIAQSGSHAGEKVRLERVGSLYEKNVKGIFQKSCFACHGQIENPKYPWYYRVPGIKQLIDHDVTEAKEHLDITNGFPFKGHGTPLSDLEAIEESIIDDSMPPWRYTLMHGDAKLSAEDRAAILDWIATSKEELGSEIKK